MKFSEVVITSRACRQEGSPCSKTSQCCGASPRSGFRPSTSPSGTRLICSKETNACEIFKP
jgi:hypothetical protein